MKVSELTGSALDKAVANAHGMMLYHEDWQPSRNWAQGGPLIEAEHINISFYDGTPGIDDWSADVGNPAGRRSYGPTPLIAAMRTYVASKFGDEAEVKDPQ